MEVVGSRYIDWLIPGLLGMNIMGTGMWGIGFSIVVRAEPAKLLKRLVATPMSRAHYLLSQMLARLVFLVLEVGALLAVRLARVRRADPRVAGHAGRRRLVGALSFGGLGAARRGRAADDRGGVGLDELRDAADVGAVGRLLLVGALPAAMQPFIQALPLTALNDALRARDARRRFAGGGRAATGGARRVGRDLLRAGVEDLPLAVGSF